MDKKLSEYQHFIKIEIEKIELELKDAKNIQNSEVICKKINKLRQYHDETVRNFQHERLVHLIVTIFFAALLLLTITALFLLSSTVITSLLLNSMILVIITILFITELFYVRHYYRLENGTQKLYQFSKKLYQLSIVE